MEQDSIHSPKHEVLVNYLRELRVIQKRTQAEVAAAIGRPQTYVSEIENRRRGLDLLQIDQFSEVYGMKTSDLVIEWERRVALLPAAKSKNRKAKPKPKAGRKPKAPNVAVDTKG